jgi:hypothetical protein
VSCGPAFWANRHAFGALGTQTRAPRPGIVDAEGGGFNPTLSMGGGAGVPPHRGRGGRPA